MITINNFLMNNLKLKELSQEIFESTYQYKGESVEEMFKRVASNLASVESESDEKTDLFYETLQNFKFIPAGRILSNAGTDYKGTSYINCFVSGFRGYDQDSMESISAELARQALILKSEGGYGFCCSVLRPRGTPIHGIGSNSPGMVEFLQMWDTQSYVITKGSGVATSDGKKKIRKGAQMVTAYIWHPDIEEFITAKQIPNNLTKFNMSVLLTDKFMTAVSNNSDWDLIFPDISNNRELYKSNWDGDIEVWKKLGGTVKIYKTVRAVDLYNLIMESTYNRAEPGCIFIDTVNSRNNLKNVETINATNPCGEQPLPVGGACLLGSINLTQYINSDRTDFDYDKLEKDSFNCVNMLDNVVDLTYMPIPEQYDEIRNKRRIGIGVTGLGSALMMMKIRYGSEESLEIIKKYFSKITNMFYKASSIIASQKGAFPLWSYESFKDTHMYSVLDSDTKELIKTYGLRNSHLTSIQPTGNTGILANNVSGGLEPVFMTEYIRSHGVDVLPENLPDHSKWKDSYFEGDVEFKTYILDGIRYKWNLAAGYTKETLVEDYAVSYLKSLGEWDELADWAKTTVSLSASDHINVMEIISPYIDAAMSKTVNLPSDYSFEDFKNLYIDAWEFGLKGLTTYRAGTMSAVLKSKDDFPKVTVRPIELPCQVRQFKNERKEWVAFIGILNGSPYEIFTGPKDVDVFPIPSNLMNGTIIKVKQEDGTSRYDFRYVDSYGYTNTLGGLSRIFDKEYWNYARFVSALFRQGTPIDQVIKVVEGLSFTNRGMNSWKAGLIRSLKEYVPDGTKAHGAKCDSCGSSNIVYEGGCMMCKDCGSSSCG
jgi:ribonucleoside-diphosphate reductase alpha chain